MKSRIYKGWVRHRRSAPTQNRFLYRMFMLYIDLAELPAVFDGIPFWSARRWAPARFKRGDYLGPADVPLDTAVRDLVAARLGRRPDGPIRMLAHLRYFGHCFNPVSFYYCYDAEDRRVETIVAEITNTPWAERHAYVLDAQQSAGRLQRFAFDKDFHVSPFMPMDMQYDWRFNEPGEHLFVHMQNFRGGTAMFDATLSMKARPLTGSALVGLLLGFPLMTIKVVTAIHWQALKLWLKKTPIYNHPIKTNKHLTEGAS
jgi:DUF1365 family protein